MANVVKNSVRGSNHEDVATLKLRIQELEKQVLDYKHRLEDLRKAKSNFIVKKEKEYVAVGAKVQKSMSIDSTSSNANFESPSEPMVAAAAAVVEEAKPCADCEQEKARRIELEKIIQVLNNELDDSKNVNLALKLQNEEAKNEFDRRKKLFQSELADAVYKEEKANEEVKKWETGYKEWMSAMETRVNNLMQTNAILQRMLEEQNPDRLHPPTTNTSSKK